MNSNQPVISLERVSYAYNGDAVIEDAALCVYPGDFLALIGPNGGGKTTLIKLMIGLLKPDAGSVRLFGENPQRSRLMVGYVPQDRHVGAGVPVSVLDVVLMGRMRGGGGLYRYSADDRRAASQVLEEVGMAGFEKRPVGHLSGGQRQRVFVARALASEPKLLVLDEPMANVDPKGQAEFYEMLKNINSHCTIVTASHDIMVLSSFVKTVGCVNRSVHMHDGPHLSRETFESVYHCPVEMIAHGIPHRVFPPHENAPAAGPGRDRCQQPKGPCAEGSKKI
ncbi:MAG: metal ABC transporter ATP-binding protein [Desulfatibacillaceae bacterium]|nr:metal ABC transporter ATP-binding protein [Desulfatibacillaceae bacterium]